MLVWVASFQRSGNTLTFRTLRDVYAQNPFCSIHKERLFMKGWRWKGEGYVVPRELKGLSKEERLEALRERPEVFFIKSHRIVDSADPAPALYIVRDGRDVHVSRAHWIAEKKQGHYDLPFDERLDKLISSGAWSEHIHAWRTRSAPTALVHFEQLVGDPAVTVKRACDEIDVPLGEPTGELTPWEELQEQDPVMHRRGEAGSWRDEMSPELAERFWRLHGIEMKALGYRPDDRVTVRAGASAD